MGIMWGFFVFVFVRLKKKINISFDIMMSMYGVAENSSELSTLTS